MSEEDIPSTAVASPPPPLVTTNFMKVFILPEAIVLLTREETGIETHPHGIKVRFAYKELDIQVLGEYETADLQLAIFDSFTHASAVEMLEEITQKIETGEKEEKERINEDVRLSATERD